MLDIALKTPGNRIRFGSEFCMYAIPSIENLEKAYNLTKDLGKEFVYVTPRLSDNAMDIILDQLDFLNESGGCDVVVNDLGTIYSMKDLRLLNIFLGRQLVYTPSRCPWEEITENPVNFFTKRKVKKIFYQTALNYEPTILFYKELGILGSDIDWIPELFPSLKFLTQNNLQLSIHLHSVPIAITRKCHMARFLGEKDLDKCSRPCFKTAYSMRNKTLNSVFYLHGNTVFSYIDPEKRLIKKLDRMGISDLVVTMNPLTRITTKSKVDELIENLS
jgi:hypothetical protein